MSTISIITPLYNGTNTIEDTFNSIISQDYTDWEWILFDDGSTDNTKEIVQKYKENYPDKIFYYEHKDNQNFGTAYTRNRAIEKSNSKYISFIDQDDIWYTDRLSHQLSIIDKLEDCAMLWSPALYWYKERSFEQPVLRNNNKIENRLYEPGELIEFFLNDLKATPLPSASIVRRSCFDKVNGFEESVRGSEDIVLWLKLGHRFKTYFDDKIIVKYRKHFESTLRRAAQSGKMNEWNLTFYKWVIDFLKSSPYDKRITEDYEFTYYTCLKKIAGKKNYKESRIRLKEELNKFPELKKKYSKDFLLDLILPFDIATKVSAKIRFVWLKNYGK